MQKLKKELVQVIDQKEINFKNIKMTQEEIKDLIKNRFKETKSKVNHVIDQRWINNLLQKLNPKEQNLLNPAINELIQEKIITVENRMGQQCLVLTEVGFEEIYQINEAETIEDIQNSILNKFKSQNSRVNDIIQMRWVNQTLFPSLNPKEQNLVNISITKLIDEEYISFDNHSGIECLVLKENGFNKLY